MEKQTLWVVFDFIRLPFPPQRMRAVIEDACHSHGAEYKNRKTGTIGDIGIFSFQASKNLPGGEGGMLVTDNQEFYYRAVVFGHYRLAADLPPEYSKYKHTSLGFKHRMSPFHAALTRVQLTRLDSVNNQRKKYVDLMNSALKEVPGFTVYDPPSYIQRVYYENNIVYDEEETGVERSTIVEALLAEGATIRSDRYPLLHMQPYFTERGSDPHALPITQSIVPKIISFPTFSWDDGSLVNQYIEAITKIHRYFFKQ